MNDQDIERLLRKAPRPTAPPGLRERLQNDIGLPSAAPVRVRSRGAASWFRQWLPKLAYATFMLVCGVVIALHAAAISELQKKSQALSGQNRAGDAARQPSAPSPSASAVNAELERLRKDNAELKSLQIEVEQLRAQSAALTQLRAENQKLIAELAALQAATPGGALERARQKAESIVCVNNLKQIGLAARIFATDHQETYPPDLISMRAELSTPKILHCPGDLARTEARSWAEFNPGQSSYELVALSSNGLKISDVDPSVILFRCPIHGHVGMADGSVLQNPERNGGVIVLKNGRQTVVWPTAPGQSSPAKNRQTQ